MRKKNSIAHLVYFIFLICIIIMISVFMKKWGGQSDDVISNLKVKNNEVDPKVIDRSINFVGMSIWSNDGQQLYDPNGDSFIAKGYQSLLKERFCFVECRDYSYSGFSLGATNAEDCKCIMNESSLWIGTSGDIWTLDSITNDFRRDIPLGTLDDYKMNTGVTTYYGALRSFGDKIYDLSGKDAIVICSNALCRNKDGYTSVSINGCGCRLEDYENALRIVAELNGWFFVDQCRLSGINDEMLSDVTIDGLHLNNEGYKLAVAPWIEQLEQIFVER